MADDLPGRSAKERIFGGPKTTQMPPTDVASDNYKPMDQSTRSRMREVLDRADEHAANAQRLLDEAGKKYPIRIRAKNEPLGLAQPPGGGNENFEE